MELKNSSVIIFYIITASNYNMEYSQVVSFTGQVDTQPGGEWGGGRKATLGLGVHFRSGRKSVLCEVMGKGPISVREGACSLVSDSLRPHRL